MHHALNPTLAARLAAAALSLGLSACLADRPVVTGSTYPSTAAHRHPIVLTDASRSLDVFVGAAAGLDPRQREDVRSFADEYRRYGQGALAAQVPAGGGSHEFAAHRGLEGIRAALAAAGVAGGHLAVSSYHPANPAVASPIRLSFTRLQAKVAGKCGQWPQDLGIGDPGFNARNEAYWNHGCATQANFAAQVADPVDLVRGRPEGRIDTVRRMRDVENLRQGKDPSTTYKQDGAGKIGTVGD